MQTSKWYLSTVLEWVYSMWSLSTTGCRSVNVSKTRGHQLWPHVCSSQGENVAFWRDKSANGEVPNQTTQLWVCVKRAGLQGRKSNAFVMKLNQIDSHALPSHCDSQHGTNLLRTSGPGFSVYSPFLDSETGRQLTPQKDTAVARHITEEILILWSHTSY